MSTGLRKGHNVVRTIFTTAPQCDEHREGIMWYVPYLPQLLSVMSTGLKTGHNVGTYHIYHSSSVMSTGLRTGHNVVHTIFTTAPV